MSKVVNEQQRVDVREQFEASVRQWPNYSERTLARDGRYPDYYGNPVVQGAWEGWKAAMRSHAVAEVLAAGDFLSMNGTAGMIRRWESARAALANVGAAK